MTCLERRVGGWRGGSTAGIWALTTHGARTLTGRATRQRNQAVSTSFLAHLLAVTETRTIIDETVRQLPGTTATITTEPDCWRSHLGTAGQHLTLRPDLHAVVTSPGYQDHYFIEVDRDTENPARVITTCHRYQAYYATGIEQQAGGVFPVTLWIVPPRQAPAPAPAIPGRPAQSEPPPVHCHHPAAAGGDHPRRITSH